MGVGMTWPLLEYVILALIGEAVFEADNDTYWAHHRDVEALAEREFALLDEIDPERVWLAPEMRGTWRERGDPGRRTPGKPIDTGHGEA